MLLEAHDVENEELLRVGVKVVFPSRIRAVVDLEQMGARLCNLCTSNVLAQGGFADLWLSIAATRGDTAVIV